MKTKIFTMIAVAIMSMHFATIHAATTNENTIPPSLMRFAPIMPSEAQFDDMISIMEPYATMLQVSPETPFEATFEPMDESYLMPAIPTEASFDEDITYHNMAPQIPAEATFDDKTE